IWEFIKIWFVFKCFVGLCNLREICISLLSSLCLSSLCLSSASPLLSSSLFLSPFLFLFLSLYIRYLDLDLVVRDKDGNILDPDSTSTVSLFRAHEAASKQIEDRIQEEKSQKQNVDLSRQAKFAQTPSFALFVTLKNVVCKIGEDAEVLMSLYDPVESKFISENYLVRWSSQGLVKDIDQLHNLRSVFTDLGSEDLKREKISFVCQIVRVGRMELRDNNTKKLTSGLRRPFGVAGKPSVSLNTETTGTSLGTGLFVLTFLSVSISNRDYWN
uniref:Dedicator of cytokinesis N-terminal domain-containing protein n=1 Tax=Oncorhynchus kisutch TaxID=8019 RepID=A0A8C7NBL0_ONCKI